jgi:hypothetical protein
MRHAKGCAVKKFSFEQFVMCRFSELRIGLETATFIPQSILPFRFLASLTRQG